MVGEPSRDCIGADDRIEIFEGRWLAMHIEDCRLELTALRRDCDTFTAHRPVIELRRFEDVSTGANADHADDEQTAHVSETLSDT
jgi:hypothetical protein